MRVDPQERDERQPATCEPGRGPSPDPVGTLILDSSLQSWEKSISVFFCYCCFVLLLFKPPSLCCFVIAARVG